MTRSTSHSRSFALVVTLLLSALLAATGAGLSMTICAEGIHAHRLLADLRHDLAMESLLAVLPDLLARTYLGLRDAEDAVADLLDRSYLQRAGSALALTPKGRECREAILQHLRDFDIEQLGSLPVSEVEGVRHVLTHLISSHRA